MKSGFVSVVGRPSAGKSTLVNALCGHKVSIVSPVPQTTRNRIRGIVTLPEGQLVFLDTPGYHLSERKMNLRMQGLAVKSLEETDLVLYVVDPTREPGAEESAIAGLVAAAERPVVVAVNKADLIDRSEDSRLRQVRLFISDALPRAQIHEVSARSGAGLDGLLNKLVELAPVGEPFYDAEYYTDQTPEFRVAEILREHAINATRQEVPHSLYVEIADLEMREEPYTHLWARAFLVVERDSQKGILVGKGGERIRAIVEAAADECSRIFPYPVKLDVRVKTRPKWRSSESVLEGLLY